MVQTCKPAVVTGERSHGGALRAKEHPETPGDTQETPQIHHGHREKAHVVHTRLFTTFKQ